MTIWGLGIGARLYFLQVVESAYYIEKAGQQQKQIVTITPRRGDILDRDGNALASSVLVDSVYARPMSIKTPEATAKVLARLTGSSYAEMLRKLDPEKSWVWIKRKISKQERDAIEQAKLPGVAFQKEFRRFYPNLQMASHLLGYVDVDEEGKTGLEGKYNGSVRGEPGKVLLLRDARGKSYQREQQVPQVGATLTTTIDKPIQFVVEKELQSAAEKTRAAAISIVVMDLNSGAILGMANYPTFNPNEYRDSDSSTWINHSLSLTYEPGSTFKMVTVAAALEEGLTNPDEKIFCENGAIIVSGRRIKDHTPYGMLSVREIIQNSSNVGTIKIAMRLGEERFKSYIDRYGFGKPTLIDLPAEVGGTVRDVSQWGKTSIASIAIGQEVSVTPLQTATMVSIIANGGIRYKPYVVQKVEDSMGNVTETKPIGNRVMSESTARQLQEMLEDVVTDGTAKTSQLEGYRAAGKTGTAQKVDLVTRQYSHTKFVASFAGFAPVSDPRIAIVVVIDEPKGLYYGGEVAAPVFKRIAEQVLRMKSVLPDVPRYAPLYKPPPERTKEKVPPRPGIQVPDVKVLDASMTSENGDRPGPSFGGIVLPDYTGQSLRQATDESDKLGLGLPQTSGTGRVVWQYPPPGSQVRPGTHIQLRLSLK
jgi:cell division protein FtsI (penicillin-binding protein 3)